ncbi:hypothetical protein [Paramaledivibacter caminithermalis]|jgi:hypothetical protein|uniref:Uncharacterized protein n=1 Tax=Paramaledivibacter caminithermalis (strain DSM 15212 / CIP 107654 / DViRD3) TaxID=1121301 RepID=A0A1M6PVV6_PARC5|nr:hypothetical protein [Paramaledivibacter caminithermalis]SHK12095.1 hypothetical protein SAMN02745912_02320 [Paramaledivibacter caminithermalis DSM 15212]
MVEIFLILLGFGCIIYKVTIDIPKDIKSCNEKLDTVKLQLKEISMKIDKISEKL